MFFDKEVLSINEEAPIMIRIHKNPI
ncbi:hypothetical protein RIR_e276_A0A2I1F3J5_9GLOM [Rhizophagus irregularis DAOM 181602=DAOM 197198]|nr:hypothetical protein RIR_e276_A0A2I1F3J5_9GLOM [Rhizophagus irregularis DAOM 181602=DAOM 197198]